MNESIGVVVVAAGYGSFRDSGTLNVPKVIEPICGVPAICQIVARVVRAGLDPVVVVNPLFEFQIRSELDRCGFQLPCIIQPDRFGPGDAVQRALPYINSDSFVMIYGDMPLWEQETIAILAEEHVRCETPLSMVTVSLGRPDTPPELERYGRVVRCPKTGIIECVVEPEEWKSSKPLPRKVNPSLMAFERDWFMSRVGRTPLFSKGDGRPDERRIPPLVALAADEGFIVNEIPLMDPREALGFNTPAELEKVRRVKKIREGKTHESLAAV